MTWYLLGRYGPIDTTPLSYQLLGLRSVFVSAAQFALWHSTRQTAFDGFCDSAASALSALSCVGVCLYCCLHSISFFPSINSNLLLFIHETPALVW